MKNIIKTALMQLDPENDAHWTVDGMARLDVLNDLIPGDSDVSRADLKEFCPKFHRKNMVFDDIVPEVVEDVQDLGTPAWASVPHDKAELTDDGFSVDNNGDDSDPIEPINEPDLSDDEAIGAELVAAQTAFDKAQRRLAEARKASDEIIRKRDESRHSSSADFSRDVQAFQQSQVKQQTTDYALKTEIKEMLAKKGIKL